MSTDLSVAIPWGTYARVAPRSGLALKKGIDTGAGVIDYDYRGPVGVVLFNHSDEVMRGGGVHAAPGQGPLSTCTLRMMCSRPPPCRTSTSSEGTVLRR